LTDWLPQEHRVWFVLDAVEQTERRMMMTKQLQEGQTFDEYMPVDQEEFRQLFRDLGNTRFVLYFVPTQPTGR
jgi:hypothetical protein